MAYLHLVPILFFLSKLNRYRNHVYTYKKMCLHFQQIFLTNRRRNICDRHFLRNLEPFSLLLYHIITIVRHIAILCGYSILINPRYFHKILCK